MKKLLIGLAAVGILAYAAHATAAASHAWIPCLNDVKKKVGAVSGYFSDSVKSSVQGILTELEEAFLHEDSLKYVLTLKKLLLTINESMPFDDVGLMAPGLQINGLPELTWFSGNETSILDAAKDKGNAKQALRDAQSAILDYRIFGIKVAFTRAYGAVKALYAVSPLPELATFIQNMEAGLARDKWLFSSEEAAVGAVSTTKLCKG